MLISSDRSLTLALLKLLEKGIIHCDISFGNTLRGAIGSHLKGVLIDLDMAMEMQNLIDGICNVHGFRTVSCLCWTLVDVLHLNGFLQGTRAFQSIKVLRGSLHHHDHMDDLESVFYLLCWICYGMDTPGGRFFKPFPKFLSSWDNAAEPERCAECKENFLRRPMRPVSPVFAPIRPLLDNMRQFFLQRLNMFMEEVYALKSNSPTPTPVSGSKTIPPYSFDGAHADHKRFLEIIDAWKKTHIQPHLRARLEFPPNDALPDSSRDLVVHCIDGTKRDQSSDSETSHLIFVTPTKMTRRLS